MVKLIRSVEVVEERNGTICLFIAEELSSVRQQGAIKTVYLTIDHLNLSLFSRSYSVVHSSIVFILFFSFFSVVNFCSIVGGNVSNSVVA